MSIRVDTVSLISGAIVCGNRGLGVVGSLIPASGDHGPGYAYNDLSLPADNAKEICGRITTWPTNGALTAYEDTSFEYSGATDTFQYQLYVDGAAVGLPTTVTLQVGAAMPQITATADDAVFSGAAAGSSASAEAQIGAAADDAVFSGAAASGPRAIISATAADTVFSGGCAVNANGRISAVAGDSVFSGGSAGRAVSYVRSPSGAGPAIISQESYRPPNTGGRRL